MDPGEAEDRWEDPETPVFPRVRHGIEFIARSEDSGELRITGDDDAGLLLWGAQWLDQHRDWIITAMRFQHSAIPHGGGMTSIVIIELAMPGTLPAGDLSLKRKHSGVPAGV